MNTDCQDIEHKELELSAFISENLCPIKIH